MNCVQSIIFVTLFSIVMGASVKRTVDSLQELQAYADEGDLNIEERTVRYEEMLPLDATTNDLQATPVLVTRIARSIYNTVSRMPPETSWMSVITNVVSMVVTTYGDSLMPLFSDAIVTVLRSLT